MIFLYCYSSQAQTKKVFGDIINSGVSEEATERQLDSVFHIWESQKVDSIPYRYFEYSLWLNSQQKIPKAIENCKKAYHQSLTTKAIDSTFTQNTLNYLGYYYRNNYQFNKSIETLKNAIQFNKNSLLIYQSHAQLATTYSRMNKYHEAQAYYELIISELQHKEPSYHLISAYFGAAVNQERLKSKKSFLKGLTYAKKADSLAAKIKVSSATQIKVKFLIASLYNHFDNLDIPKAKTYLDEALVLAKKEKNTTHIIKIYAELGNLYQTTEFQKALSYHHNALQLTPDNDTFQKYIITVNIGYTYAYAGDYVQGLPYFHNALQILTGSDFRDHTMDYRSLFTGTSHKTSLHTILPILGETYLQVYKSSQDCTALEKSLAYFKMADQVLDYIKLSSSAYKSRLFWRKASADIYGKAIRAAFLDNDPEQAFYFMEKNKSLLLLEDLALQEYKRNLNLPNSVIKKEEYFNKAILATEQQLKVEHQDGNIMALNKKLFDLNLKKSKLADSIRVARLFDFEPQIKSLSQVQSTLQTDELIISYHISKDDGYGIYSNNNNGYLICASREQTYFFEISNLLELEIQIRKLIKLTKTSFKTKEDILTYQKLSHTVFNGLFPTKELQQRIKNKKLVIAPDNYLSLLSFDTLCTSGDALDFLIYESEIRYVYSHSFLQNSQQPSTTALSVLGIAPSHFQDKSLALLEYNDKEVQALDTVYESEIYTTTSATSEQFIKAVGKHNIIHLATHADAQSTSTPWMAFADKKLTLDELYLIKNRASLVFLSGCNTGLGEQENGEGVMSLARGFFYGGAQSVISSLWSIDDRATPAITTAFYTNLSNGDTKATALRKAKLDYLKNTSGSEASPYYWGAFIVLGNNTTLAPSTSYHWVLWGVLLLIIITSFLSYLKYSKLSM